MEMVRTVFNSPYPHIFPHTACDAISPSRSLVILWMISRNEEEYINPIILRAA